jgi:triosephosphate isomerase
MIKRTTPIVVGNWKSTPKVLSEGVQFVKQLEKKLASSKIKLPKKSYYLAVPEIFIPSLSALAKSGYVGAETVHGTVLGQITGATTPSQLLSGGAAFTLIGHSEVRARGETVEERSQKVLAALSVKLPSVVCFGEKHRDKEGKYLEELENDIKHTLSLIKRESFANLIVAYEPVWAIGAAEPATAPECFEAVIAMRRALAALGGIEYAKKVQILYGGAVTKENVQTFLDEGGVDGLLIGRASQEVISFVDILKAAYSAN